MEINGRKVGDVLTYVPEYNGNRGLSMHDRVEVDLLPLSNAEFENFAALALQPDPTRGNVAATGLQRDPTRPVRCVLIQRVSAIRNLRFGGSPIVSGADLERLMDDYRSEDLAALIREIVQAASDVSTLEQGLRKN
ncbi:MAG: hypothetical protein P9M14_13530 [Candidatus Alcyoniella australis]|nr:hypothetical protein [Candidatus Alcyoniella australis]